MNYQETNISGEVKSWRRAHTITSINPHNGVLTEKFDEEDRILLPDGRSMVTNNTSCEASYDLNGEMPLRNPSDGSPLSPEMCAYIFASMASGTLTHIQYYIIRYSVYMDVAMKRDYLLANPPVVEAPAYTEDEMI